MKISALPKVSVIVPAFNEEKYITRTLSALVAQDYPDYEIIIADNASTDDTALLVNAFIDNHNSPNRRIILVSELRKGTNYARECARQAATGSVIAQIDADCVPSKFWISKGVAALCGPGARVAVTGPYDYFDGDFYMRHCSLLMQKASYPIINTCVQLAGRAAILIGGNAFIRAQVLEQVGGYNTALTFYGDDVDLGKKLSVYGWVGYIPSLVQPSSFRRYKAIGFWQVNKKYQSFFWSMVWQKQEGLATLETSHPR